MVTTKLRFAAVTLLLTPTLCLAWGADGHRIVGEIARHYLTNEAEAAVKDLLGDQTLADASAWADERVVEQRPYGIDRAHDLVLALDRQLLRLTRSRQRGGKEQAQ